jgi:hypothetical protein
MKKMLATIAAVAVMGMASIASATTWTDTVVLNVMVPPAVTYNHDLTDDGFDVGTDLILNYVLNIALHDDGGRWDFAEIAFVNQPGLLGDGFYNFAYTNQNFGWSLYGLFDLNTAGNFDVTISSWLGDFMADSSTLTAYGCEGSAPVPEPSTMLMLGAGLLGLGLYGRRRVQK